MVISVVFPFDHCGQYCSQLLGSGFCRDLDFSALLVVLLGMELPCQNDNSVKRFEKLADCLKFLYWLKLLKIQAQQFKKKLKGLVASTTSTSVIVLCVGVRQGPLKIRASSKVAHWR